MNAFGLLPVSGNRLPDPQRMDAVMPSRNAFSALPKADMPAPPPVQPAMSAPASAQPRNPFAMQPKAQPNPVMNAFKGLAAGYLGSERTKALDQEAKAAETEDLGKKMASLEQLRALPVEERVALIPQLQQAIGQEIPESLLSDQELDRQLVLMRGQAGIAPAVPEPMSAYQAAQIKMEQDKAGRPTYFNTADGVVSIGPDGKGTLAYDVPEKPVQPNLPDGWQVGPDGKPQPIPGYAEWYRKMHPGDASGAGGVAGAFRTLSPEEVHQRGYSPGTVVQVDGRGKEYVNARPSTAQTGQPTEGERNAGMHVSVSLNGLQNIMAKEADGYNRAGLGEQLSTFWGENEKLYDQAAAEFIDGYLRAMTGAAATNTEIDTYRKQWFPQFGDNEKVIKQKSAGRLNAIRAMKAKAGRAWNPAWDSVIQKLEGEVGGIAKVAPPSAAPALTADEQSELEALRAELGMQ